MNASALSCSAAIRSTPDYFQVDEQLPFAPDGEGGHVWLRIKKRNTNTDWLALELAKFAKVPPVAVGYAGMKDRHAITIQWFSVNMEGVTEPEWTEFETEDIQIVEQTRHNKKLKRGVLSGNIFTLILTELSGDEHTWQTNLETIKQQGVPNYFAEQRFGHSAGNLERADHWFNTGKAPKKRNQRSIYLSAARSWLFNLVLSHRVMDQTWNAALIGDAMLLAGTRASLFSAESNDDDIKARLTEMDIHPTGPLWGKGEQRVQAETERLETMILQDWSTWQQGLEKAGLKQERRALRLFPQNFDWKLLDTDQLKVCFFLPAGCYATAVMRELAVISDASVIKRK
jgi:tRNA pseudouridine13 synthase